MFRRKKKQVSPPTPAPAKPLTQAAQAKTKKAIAFFNGEKSAVDLIELEKGKFVHSGHTKTIGDKFFELIEGKDLWQSLALIVTMVFVIAVALWGISQ